jgi:hypothetical protein
MSIKEEKDNSMLLDCVITTNALKKITTDFKKVVSNMVKSGQKVPQIYKDFINVIDPEAPTDKEIIIENKPPLYKLTGLDEFGNVKVKTETPLEIKRGDIVLKLDSDRLKNTVENSKNITPLHIGSDPAPLMFSAINGEVKFPSLKNGKEEEMKNYLGLDENGVLKKIEIPQSVNKNAYELREMILKSAIEIVNKYSTQSSLPNTVDQILKTANQFYSFVENKQNYRK